MLTPNTNIKIIRLHGGEDIMADILQDEENDTIMLDNPMQVIFKRIPTGQTVMMMMPWLPIEIIENNQAILYTSDILTIVDPKASAIKHYGDVVMESQKRMEEIDLVSEYEEDEDEEETEETTDFNVDELLELLKEKKNKKLH